MTGMIFDIQKFSIHDGPGIRTTVFFKGCPLRCCWCHNPESTAPYPQLSFTAARCIGCGACLEHCPSGAHRLEQARHVIERTICSVCGTCTTTCYAEALEIVGRRMSVDQVMEDVLKDRSFYQTSGGGMTLSGGEPLAQLDFCTALLQRARQEKLHTCMETSGYCPWSHLQQVRPFTDLFLYDIKETDPERHRRFTGVSNEVILENLGRLHRAGADVIVRLPIVPGLNDTEEHFNGIAGLATRLPGISGFEIMPYHNLGEGKLERLGMKSNERACAEPPTPDMVSRWIGQLDALGVPLLNEKPD